MVVLRRFTVSVLTFILTTLVVSVKAQGIVPFGFAAFNASRTVITQDPDLVLSINVRAKGTTRSLAGINNKKGVHCVVPDVGRLELIPVPASKGKPLEIVGGGFTSKNTGDFKSWPKLIDIDGNIGCAIDLEDGRNGDRFLRMYVLVKKGRRVEHHWLFGGTAKEKNLEAGTVFSFHVLSLRDGDGNLRPWHLHADGRVNYDSIIETLDQYGSGLTPGYELAEGREKTSSANNPSGRRILPARTESTQPPTLAFSSAVKRYVMVQWLDAADAEGPQDKLVVLPSQTVELAVRQGYPTFDVYCRFKESEDWVRVLSNGVERSFPTPTRRRLMPFDERN